MSLLATAPTGTPALSVMGLAALMTDAAERALDPEQRFANESDAVMYGKLTQLDCLAESVWTADHILTFEEEKAMRAAQERLTAAWNRMADAVCAA